MTSSESHYEQLQPEYPRKGPVFLPSIIPWRSKLKDALWLSEVLSLSWQRLALLRAVTSSLTHRSAGKFFISPGLLDAGIVQRRLLLVSSLLLAGDIVMGFAFVSLVMNNGGSRCLEICNDCLRIFGVGDL